MGITKIENKDYKITRHGFGSFWKFWQVDVLEFSLPTSYQEAYEEVQHRTPNGVEYSMELSNWVKDDIRHQLKDLILKHSKVVSKAKRLSVKFRTTDHGQHYIDGTDFYIIEGEIYFDSDDVIKREKILEELGI